MVEKRTRSHMGQAKPTSCDDAARLRSSTTYGLVTAMRAGACTGTTSRAAPAAAGAATTAGELGRSMDVVGDVATAAAPPRIFLGGGVRCRPSSASVRV